MDRIIASISSEAAAAVNDQDKDSGHDGAEDRPDCNGGKGDDEDDEDDIEDILNDIKGIGYPESKCQDNGPDEVPDVNNRVEDLTEVQDVSKVVDKAIRITVQPSEVAEEKLTKLNEKQSSLEKRLAGMTKRVCQIRCRIFGAHAIDQIQQLRSAFEQLNPSPETQTTNHQMILQPNPTAPIGNPQMPFFQPIHPGIDGKIVLNPPVPSLPTSPMIPVPLASPQPGGMITLPNLPASEVPVIPTMKDENPELAKKKKFKKTKKDRKIKVQEDHENQKSDSPLGPSDLEKEQLSEALGRIKVNLKHLMQSYDSEATESSSGGESCDEMESFDPDAVKVVPIDQRARYTWLTNRAGIASRWTWLTAQIADLEYRIRQQTELYRQIRNVKGAVTLGRQEAGDGLPAGPEASGDGEFIKGDDQSVFRLTDDTGRKITVKGPKEPPPEEDVEDGSSRTRPVQPFRRRCVLSTKGLYRLSARAARESNVQCGCIHPMFSCSICFGRANHSQAPDPVFQDRTKCVSLIDHSYHQVLSRSNKDVPADLLITQKLKNRSWIVGSPEKDGSLLKAGKKDKQSFHDSERKKKKLKDSKKKKKMLHYEELFDDDYDDYEPSSKKKNSKRRVSEGSATFMSKKKRLRLLNKRRKSVTVHHHSDGNSVAMADIDGDYGEAVTAIPTPASHHLLTMGRVRRRRETSFDIDNIVIPYSTMASARVERLKYKEIQTPYWRVVEDGTKKEDDAESLEAKLEESLPVDGKSQELKDEIKEEPPDPAINSSGENEEADPSDETATADETINSETKYDQEEELFKEMVDDDALNEDISEAIYKLRHYKAEIEEKARWAGPSSGTGGQRSTTNRSNRRHDSRQSADASSGCNTPDPLSPGVVERVDTLEVTTRPSSPTNDEAGPSSVGIATVSQPGNIRNRRRTSSTTRSRDRNPSEDFSNPSRCTTPTQSQFRRPFFEHDTKPYEPRQFPLTDECYELMLASGNSENDAAALLVHADQVQPSKSGSSKTARRSSISAPQVVISRLRMSQDSSMDEDDEDEVDSMEEEEVECDDEELEDETVEEEDEEDTEWMEEVDDDPDDPEWTERDNDETAPN